MRCKVCGDQVESGVVLHSECLDKLLSELIICRNELCLECGEYSVDGGCDYCRFNQKEVDKWRRLKSS